MRKDLSGGLLTTFALIVIFLAGCKRANTELLGPVNNPNTEIVDDAVQVTASVSGIVLNESNQPIQGATVISAISSTVTNAFGAFSFRNISMSKENGSVTVLKTGYFNGVRTFKTTAGKDHTVKIQLMQKVLSGTVTSAIGGTIQSNGGASINFPANAFVNNNGAAYNGTVNVYSRWIDPTANNLPLIIPGDLRGIALGGVENILQTYGMVGAEIEDASGNTLKIASGKNAVVSFPVPATLNATAPESIALWHFDNTTARWKEEGTATKSGTNYIAQVNKFSFWNCDRGINNYIQLDYTLINSATNAPLVGTVTRVKIISSNAYGYGFTNNTGFVSGLVPKNEPMVLEVMAGSCLMPVFSQPIGPFTTNTSLGNVNVALPSTMYINFTGIIMNCSAAPVTNGYLSLYGAGGNSGFANTDVSGNFSFSILNCTGSSLAYSYVGVDNTTSQESTVATGSATTATINLGTVNACSAPASADIYVAGFEPINSTSGNSAKVWKNGIATNLTDGTMNGLAYGVYVSGNDVYVTGREDNNTTGFSTARVWKNGTVMYTLTNGTDYAQANAVVVSGADVYVAGSEGSVAKVWKNGVATNLPGTSNVHGNAMVVVGSDIYVAGSDNVSGKVWKNGTVLFSMNGVISDFKSIFVSGTDVYVAGTEYDGSKNVGKVWKNGIATILNSGPTESKANGVFVSGADVYVAGTVTNPTGFFTVAKIWKNGIATDLTNGSHFGNASGVVVSGSDVYVVGGDQNASGSTVAVVWKNGFPINITDGTFDAFATSMFIR